MKATNIQTVRDGAAYWYAIADTELGKMFVKLPLVGKGGLEGNWREFVAMRLATNVGLPTLSPHPIDVDPQLLSDADRVRTLWELGSRFTGTPFQENFQRGRGYDELTSEQRALLYAFDNLLYYTDRARPSVGGRQDCWLADDGHPVILDWDVYPAPDLTGPGNSTEVFGWDYCSKFLILSVQHAQVLNACRAVAALSEQAVLDTVAEASKNWPHVKVVDVARWIIRRRDNLVHAAENNEHPPWLA